MKCSSLKINNLTTNISYEPSLMNPLSTKHLFRRPHQPIKSYVRITGISHITSAGNEDGGIFEKLHSACLLASNTRPRVLYGISQALEMMSKQPAAESCANEITTCGQELMFSPSKSNLLEIKPAED